MPGLNRQVHHSGRDWPPTLPPCGPQLSPLTQPQVYTRRLEPQAWASPRPWILLPREAGAAWGWVPARPWAPPDRVRKSLLMHHSAQTLPSSRWDSVLEMRKGLRRGFSDCWELAQSRSIHKPG